jgi:hypothetical protein
MTNTLKTLLATTAATVLFAGAACAQDAQQEAPAPETTVETEAVDSMDTPQVDDYATETIETDSKTKSSEKMVEEVEAAVDTNKIDASSETELPAEEAAPEAEVEAEPKG